MSEMSDIGAVELVFLLLLLFVVVFGLLARHFGMPYPIVMVIGGLLLGLVPGIPRINLNPDLIFLVILPPLLYASAWTTSWRDFRYHLVSILFLAFGLVAFTVVGVGLVAPHVIAGFDWRLGLVLGAVVAPTDAIAATSIARRVGLPQRVVDILEGESLINDATGLLALQFAVGIVISRQIPTVSAGVLTMLWLVVGGIGLGLLVGWVVDFFEKQFDDGPIEITLSILVPYAVYLAADALHASGVLAVVSCGIFLSRRSANLFSPAVRIQIWSFWQSFTFVLNGVVFVLIGLQLPSIRAAILGASLPKLILQGAALSVLLILLRMVWTFPGAQLSYFIRTRFEHQKEKPPKARQVFIIGWTGMRGVVSLAAALALPVGLPHRELIVFLTFCVIVVTLVVQGITLPSLVHALGLAGSAGPNCEEQEARRIVTEAALTHLEEGKAKDSSEFSAHYDHLAEHYRERLSNLNTAGGDREKMMERGRFIELSREALRIERDAAVRLRDEGRIGDDILRRIERELDLTESRFATATE